jgi:hypothetical protein
MMVIWSRSLRVKTCRECKNQETPAESLAVKNENIRVLTFSLPAGSGAQGSLMKIQDRRFQTGDGGRSKWGTGEDSNL